MKTQRESRSRYATLWWQLACTEDTFLSRFLPFFCSQTRRFFGLVAAASILVPFSAATCFAQEQMLTLGEAEPVSRSGNYEATLPAQPGFPPLELPPVTQSTASSSPQGEDPGKAADPVSLAGSPSNLKVNPITGLVSANGTYVPLTGDQRWKLYWKMNFFSVGAYFGPFFTALLLDQATGSPAEWGGGFKGYGKRVGTRTASAILQGTFQAPVAYLLHEDVRYIMSPRPGFKRRALHAVACSFLTYNSSGHPTLNISNLGSYYASTAVSTAWLPGHYKVLSYTLSNGSEQIALSVPVNLLQEFWPEIMRALHRH